MKSSRATGSWHLIFGVEVIHAKQAWPYMFFYVNMPVRWSAITNDPPTDCHSIAGGTPVEHNIDNAILVTHATL
jgi:hypothetical protein